MWTRDKWMIAIVLLLSTAIPACSDDDDDDGGTDPETEFEANLSGNEEEPPVVTPASGSATVSIQGSAIVYRVDVENLENVVVSHIHIGPPGENGPVRMNLCNTDDTPDCATETTGVLVEGSNGITQGGITFDSLVSAIRTGGAYVNVHTSDGVEPANTGPGDFPGGEIRGQLTPQ
jgi:hypothetical protein